MDTEEHAKNQHCDLTTTKCLPFIQANQKETEMQTMSSSSQLLCAFGHVARMESTSHQPGPTFRITIEWSSHPSRTLLQPQINTDNFYLPGQPMGKEDINYNQSSLKFSLLRVSHHKKHVFGQYSSTPHCIQLTSSFQF